MKEKMFPLIRKRNTENGFTLIELIVVVLIIGILATIAITTYIGQQKNAIQATVKHDLMTNKALIAEAQKNTTRLYLPYDDFMKKGVRTEGNILGYSVNSKGTEACTFTSHRFSDTELYSYHFSSKTGTIEEGLCDPSDNTGYIENPEPEQTPTPPVTPNIPPINFEEIPPISYPGTPEPGPEQTPTSKTENGIKSGNAVTNFTTKITTNVFYRACMEIKVTTTSETPVPWSIILDRTLPPFKDNYVDNNGEGDYTITEHTNYMEVHGNSTVKETTKNKPITFTLCVPAPGTQPIDRTTNENTNTPKTPQGGEWYAYQEFQIQGTSTFYSNWTTEVDLKDLITKGNKVNGNPRVDVGGLTLTKIAGTKYRITSKIDGDLSTRNEKPTTITVRLG